MVSFDLAESVDVARFLASVRVFTFAESLGGVESLVTCPSVQTHADVPVEVRASYGLTDRLLRLSVGIEDPDDLVADLERALTAPGAPGSPTPPGAPAPPGPPIAAGSTSTRWGWGCSPSARCSS